MADRVVICGGPNSGKTTLANSMNRFVRHTDDLMSLGWSPASEAASAWFDAPGLWVVEGVAAPRALRKWLKRNPEGKPCDEVIYLTAIHGSLSEGQSRMRKGVKTVFLQILPELHSRGVEIKHV